MRDENVVFAEYMAAEDPTVKETLQAELVRLLKKHAYAICWLHLREPRKDIVNFAIFRALKNAETFRGDSLFSTWFAHIVQNLCHDAGREKARHQHITGIEDLSPEEQGMVAVDATEDTKVLVQQLLEGLDKEDRTFVEAKLAGKNEAELSEELGLTREGVRSRWKRIRQRISQLT